MSPALQKTLVYVALCLIGFFIYGPVALTGVQALNLVPKNAAGTAAGFVGLFGLRWGGAMAMIRLWVLWTGFPGGVMTDGFYF